MNICLNCQKDTKNPKFCSSSCSASYHNKLKPKRLPEGFCRVCEALIPTKKTFCSDLCKSMWTTERHEHSIKHKQKYNGQRVTEWRRRLKLRAVQYLGGYCQICGYNRFVQALVFHHLDPSIKEFAISSSRTTRGWIKIKHELAKCALLCTNCHNEVHAGLIFVLRRK